MSWKGPIRSCYSSCHKRQWSSERGQSNQARIGRGRSRGFKRTPPFDLWKILYTLTAHFKYPTVWKWSTILAAIENHRCPNESGCSYSTRVCEFVHGGPARNARITCLRHCDERTRVIMCVNKSVVHTLKSCPSSEVNPCTCCSANPSTFSRENSKSAGLVNAYIDS